MGFVEVVDSPNEAALNVAPCAEVLDMQIAHGQYVRRFGQFRTHLRPNLRPAIKSRAQKRKHRRLHAGVFEEEILLDQIGAVTQPILELTSSLYNVHSAER